MSKKLISMVDFVLEQQDKVNKHAVPYRIESLFKIENYATFLKQPLELWMFVETEKECCGRCIDGIDECILEAKSRVLFEGFNYNKAINERSDGTLVCGSLRVIHNGGLIKGIVWGGTISTIEDLTKYNLELTQNALKQLSL